MTCTTGLSSLFSTFAIDSPISFAYHSVSFTCFFFVMICAHHTQDKYKFSEKDSQDIADFLLPMLAYEPAKRATAQQMLTHPWLHDA